MRVHVKRFEEADETRAFERGRFDVLTVGKLQIGRARYEPGWKWSEHVGAKNGSRSCDVEHVCMVVSGRAMIEMDSGERVEVGPGDVFYCAPGHDSWVVGDEPYVSLHFMGAESYAGAKPPAD